MRGCLSFLVFAALLIGLALWFALPPAAAGLVGITLSAAGFDGRDTRVAVEAEPPLELLSGHADRLTIASSDVRTGSLTAASFDLDLRDLDLLARSARATSGTLSDVTVTDASGGSLRIRRIDIAGPTARARATLVVDEAEIARRVLEAVSSAGLAVTSVSVDPPDGLVVEALGRRVRAGLSVGTAGVIELTLPALGPVPIVAPPPNLGATFDSVTVAADHSVVIDATMDLRSILGG
ncbi:MAG TPA: hypothetical protein VFS32_04620 [Candidatus Limnocylindrales bacterium]|nr:hypothetical protein [Candidatus Limnocylindrales bacterium]